MLESIPLQQADLLGRRQALVLTPDTSFFPITALVNFAEEKRRRAGHRLMMLCQ